MNYSEAATYLNSLPRFALEGEAAYAPGLERIASMLEGMGNPHRAYPVVHIGGTNGKGSTASFLSSILVAAGRKTGLHTSPHLFELNERMRVNGVPASEEWVADAVGRFQELFAEAGASFFEATVALSFLYFAEQEVDLAVVEVGLGGRLDATNIVSPDLVIITSIGLDHTHILGNSIRDISREKAGIIKPGVPVLSGVTQPDAIDEIQKKALAEKANLVEIDAGADWFVNEESITGTSLSVFTQTEQYPVLEIGLSGAHQVRNAVLALLAAEFLASDVKIDKVHIAEGLAKVSRFSGLKGRLEVVQKEPLVVLDVGHNLDGVRAALAFMAGTLAERQGRLSIMFGMMRDKNVHQIAKLLSETGDYVYLPSLNSDRAIPSQELADIFSAHNTSVMRVASLDEGLYQFYEDTNDRDGLLIVGSHLLAAQLPKSLVS